ncbi:MAG: hypothetical protein H0Z28_04935 [Archaeoglobus sp.]|nr:hypothetical protein [Archaeoglobus sp.]
MQNIKIDFRALASLLGRAYSGEFAVGEALAESLLHTTDDSIWDSLFIVMYDCEAHRLMIEEIVRLLGFEIESFREFALKTVSIKRYIPREEGDMRKFLEEALRWEIGSQKYYSHLLNLDYSDVAERIGEDKVNKIKETLKELAKWESRHVKTIEEILSKND